MWHLMTRSFAAPGPSIKETPVPRTAHSNPAKSLMEGLQAAAGAPAPVSDFCPGPCILAGKAGRETQHRLPPAGPTPRGAECGGPSSWGQLMGGLGAGQDPLLVRSAPSRRARGAPVLTWEAKAGSRLSRPQGPCSSPPTCSPSWS